MSTLFAIIKKRKGKFHLVSHKGKTLGVHATREGALKQEQAIEIAKHARQLADGIGQFLAATDHDDKGRFTGPGGGSGGGTSLKSTQGASKKAYEATKNNDNTMAGHKEAARAHRDAATAHGKRAAETGNPEHLKAADAHTAAANEHSNLAQHAPLRTKFGPKERTPPYEVKRTEQLHGPSEPLPKDYFKPHEPKYETQQVPARLQDKQPPGSKIERRADYKPLREDTYGVGPKKSKLGAPGGPGTYGKPATVKPNLKGYPKLGSNMGPGKYKEPKK